MDIRAEQRMDEVKLAMGEAGIDAKHYPSIAQYLQALRNKHEGTYSHVLRVGRLAARMADYAEIPGVTRKMMMWAGLLHDIGKALVPADLLDKTAHFDAADRAAMEPHVLYGWQLLEKIHGYTAHVIVRHHRYGKAPYPRQLPPLPYYLEPRQETLEAAARLLALADYYDALTTRNNDRQGGHLTREEKREVYLRENPGFEPLIRRLERAGVFTFESL